MIPFTVRRPLPLPSNWLAGSPGLFSGTLSVSSFVSFQRLSLRKHVTRVVHKQGRLTPQTFQELIVLDARSSLAAAAAAKSPILQTKRNQTEIHFTSFLVMFFSAAKNTF